MRETFFVPVGLLLVSCALPVQRFVDENGLPIQGALVMSSFAGHKPFGGARATAYLTDVDGYAPVASLSDVVAIMPRYHTWTSDGHDDRGRSTMTSERDAVVMHPRSEGPQPEVRVSRHEMRFITSADEVQAVPLSPEIGVTVELVDRTEFRVRAALPHLRGSARFYFAGPSPGPWVTDLRQADDLFFYVQAPPDRFFKVGVTRMHTGKSTRRLEIDGVQRHIPTETVTVIWADLGAQPRAVEPHVAQVRTPWFGTSAEVLLGDAPRVAAALEAAVRRGDVESCESTRAWLDRLRAAALLASEQR